MTIDEFQRCYHEYRVDTLVEAEAEAATVNQTLEVTSSGPVVAVDFGDLGCGLMLKSARDFIFSSDIVRPKCQHD